MNRETKFRAWDECKKVMHYNFQFIKSGNKENDWIVFTSDKHNLKHEPHPFEDPFSQQQLKIMQYTGLNDINKVEIYEGDIVQRGIITFSRGKFQGTYFDGNGNLEEDWEDDLYQEKNIKVLGNIYENPELLKS